MTATAPSTAASAPGADSVISGFAASGIDYAALWRQVEAESARAVVVDLGRRVIVGGRSMGESGDSPRAGGEPLERLFPGAAQRVESWCAEGAVDSLVTHSLSPRQWAYFWRLDASTGLLAVVHHRFGRGAVSAGDASVIRVLCEHWLASELQPRGVGPAALVPWNHMERRARNGSPRGLKGALATVLVTLAVGFWLALGAPGIAMGESAQAAYAREAERLGKLSDQTLVRSVSHALAGQDYGEVQEALAEHLAFGHFAAAAVLNPREQVVAHAGFARPPTIGQSLPANLEGGVRRLTLNSAGQALGMLVTVQRAAPEFTAASLPSMAGVRAAGALLVVASLVGGALLWRHLGSRYR